MKLLFLAFILTISTTLSAFVVKSIKYEGLGQMSEAVALRMLKFDAGDNIEEDAVDAAIKNYFKQEYFEDIWTDFDEDKGVLTFHFKERSRISKIELKGWKENDSEVKESVLQLKVGAFYDEKKLEGAKKRIVEAINQEGKIDSVVEVTTESLENGSKKVTFTVNEGEEIIIESLKYSGLSALTYEAFGSVVANKERESFGWLWGRNDGKMKAAELSYDHLRMRDIYMQHGFLDAQIDEPFARVDFDNYTATVSYQVEEGKPYTISAVTINQEKEVIDEASIKALIKLKAGETFNIETFRSDSQKIKTLIADLSYAFVQVVPDLKKDKEKQTVEVVFKIMPGEKVKIRDVIISGNSRTLDRIIRREMFLGPNDSYSLTDLTDSRNALGRLGFFDSNTIEEKRVDAQTMDLVVKVKEAPTGNIQLGGGYGSYGGLLVSVAVDDRNIWGSGINVGVKAERSELTSNYSFSISNPRLNDSDFSGNFSIYTTDMEYNDYTTMSDGINFGLGHRFTRYISGGLSYGYSANSYEFEEDTNATFDTYYLEDYTKSSVTANIKYDDTDDYYLPRKGIVITQSIEKAGLGADANFIKSRTTFGAYKGLEEYVGFDLIARYKARLFYEKETGFLPLAERFYMGGIGSVRGYESYSLSPTIADANATDGIRRVGGEYTASNSFELSFPLVPKAKMRAVTYLDYGYIGTSDRAEGDYITQSLTRGGFGAGLEWFSPVGPIQIMFSKPLGEKEGDKTAVFEFTMGQRF